MQNSFKKLTELCKKLREECAWDRRQTILSYYRFLLAEAEEFCEAVEKGDNKAIKDELGDVLWNILFIADLAEREGMFKLKDVMENTHEKMTRRHPHVFKGEPNEVENIKKRWDEIKKEEKDGQK